MSVNSQPAYDAVAVALADDDDLTTRGPCDALYVGTGGTVIILTKANREATFVNVPDGAILPVGATQVKSTANGTTASDILALYTGV